MTQDLPRPMMKPANLYADVVSTARLLPPETFSSHRPRPLAISFPLLPCEYNNVEASSNNKAKKEAMGRVHDVEVFHLSLALGQFRLRASHEITMWWAVANVAVNIGTAWLANIMNERLSACSRIEGIAFPKKRLRVNDQDFIFSSNARTGRAQDDHSTAATAFRDSTLDQSLIAKSTRTVPVNTLPATPAGLPYCTRHCLGSRPL